MLVKFHPEADIELHEAVEWYSSKRLGLDSEFMLCIDEAIERIKRNPEIFPVALRNARKTMVKRFPYTIYYEYEEDKIMILAIFHGKRNPKHWQRRA